MTGELEVRLWFALAALLVDAGLGEPAALWRRISHPVVLMGAAIGWMDQRFNSDNARPKARSAAGGLTAALILGGGLLAGAAMGVLGALFPYGGLLEVLIIAVLLSGRGLYDAVTAVKTALTGGDLPGGRDAVAHIVGRDPQYLDEPGVARAGIESLAENFSDGVVAPLMWYLLFGLPGLVACKAVNTADSMIGHRTPRHLAFGAATAHLDDVLNWVPARISGGLIALAALVRGRDWLGAIAAMKSDARRHRSVNAGWPEAAMAGALGLALAGPRVYGGEVIDDALMNAGGRRNAGPDDVAAALDLYVIATAVLGIGLGVAVIFAII